MKKVLIICAQPPWPPNSGTPLRSWGWLRTAAKVAKIGLVSVVAASRMQEFEKGPLQAVCDYLRLIPIPRTATRRMQDVLLAMLNKNPYVVQAAQAKRMSEAVAEAIEHWQPDIVQAEWIGALPYLEEARKRGIPSLYAAHNVEYQTVVKTVPTSRIRLPPFAAARLCALESRHARRADMIVTVTDQDRRWFTRYNSRVRCIPNSLFPDEYTFTPPSSRPADNIVFVGHLRYPPNVEAAEELLTHIFPEIRKQAPLARCLLAGRNPSPALRHLAGRVPAVTVEADVADIRTVWSKASMLLCPLHSGGGSRLKLLEAAACGVPIVATPFSASGLSLAPGKDYCAASQPEEFITASLAILRNAKGVDELATQARETIMRHHNWDALHHELQHLYEDLAHHYR